jgi:cysteine desulfurase
VQPIYLDHNATTPLDNRVGDRMRPFFRDRYGNAASRDHAFGWDAAEAVERARDEVAALINATSREIIFTSSATESINWALKGLAPAADRRARVITCATEHASVLETCRQMGRLAHLRSTVLAVSSTGAIDLAALADAVRPGYAGLVAIMAANNEIGTIHPIRDIARIAHDAGALLFSDLTQAVGRLPVDIRADEIDVAAFSAHKLYGPKGVGALYVRGDRQIALEPLIAGGSEEKGMRAGTLNVPGIVGFGEACRLARIEMREEGARVRRMRDRLESTLAAELSRTWVNGDADNRLPNTTNIGFSGINARALIRDMHDIAVSTRSACASGDEGPSHVLLAIGLGADDAHSCLRFSLGRFNTESEITYAIDKVLQSARRLRANANCQALDPRSGAGDDPAVPSTRR